MAMTRFEIALYAQEVAAKEKQVTALERIATAMERQNEMDEQKAAPLRVHVDGQAKKAPRVVTTPAPEIPKLEEVVADKSWGLDDDEVEPLSNES